MSLNLEVRLSDVINTSQTFLKSHMSIFSWKYCFPVRRRPQCPVLFHCKLTCCWLLIRCAPEYISSLTNRWQQTRPAGREHQLWIKVERTVRAQRSARFNLSTALWRRSGSYRDLQPAAIQPPPPIYLPWVCVDQHQHISCLKEETESSWILERVNKGQLQQGGRKSKPNHQINPYWEWWW